MKRLLIATDSFLPRWDGVARFLNEILPCLKERYEVTVVAPDFPGEFEPEGFKVERIPLSWLKAGDYVFAKCAARRIKSLVKEHDLVWTHTIGPVGGLAIHYGSRLGVPVASYVHSIEWELVSMSISRRYFNFMLTNITKMFARWLYNRSSLLLVPSNEVRRILERERILTTKKLVYLGTDPEKFHPADNRAAAKKRIGIDKDNVVIGFVGRIGREKGLMTLHDAFMKLQNEDRKVKLLMVGSGLKEWETIFRSAPNIKMVGSKNDVIPYLQAMDIYVLPSLTETTSLSTLEAMSCGCAVLSTKVGLVKNYVKDKINGSFFPKGNEMVLKLKLKWLVDNPDIRHEMGESARRTIKRKFNWKRTENGVIEALESLS